MRVAMVSEHASPLAVVGGVDAGGQNVYVAALASALARRGMEVTVHTRRDAPGLPDRVRTPSGVVVDHVPAGPARPVPKDDLLAHMDAFTAVLRDRWERRRPDIAHSHFWMSGRAALEAGHPLGVPVAHTFHALGSVKRRHQGALDTSPAQRLDEERRIVATADRIVATCTDEVFELRRLGADLDRVTIVPCGVDLDRFRPDGDAEPRPGGRGHRHRLVTVGRLVERKGIADVVAALAGLEDAELVVAGGPHPDHLGGDEQVAGLRSAARRGGVAARVDLRGRVPHEAVASLLRSADVVVCAPWYEPFGMVPLEAMACGVPVVVSAVGGLVDTVVDGVTGLHVPPRRPGELCRALRWLLADPARRARLGAAGVRRVRERYGWDRLADATLRVYADLVGHRPAELEPPAPVALP
ncbi:MAG: glycosyltransferase [Actinobacteria bacterium]|nr:glycosyltransferase [Actinomycetota bacterium]